MAELSADARLDFLMKLEQAHFRERQENATGWAVVCVDTEARPGWQDPWNVAFVCGIYPSDRDALEAAAEMDAADVRHGSTGWKHIVAPVFPP